MSIEQLIIELIKYDKDCEVYISIGNELDEDYTATSLKETEFEEWDNTITLKG